MTAFNDVSDAFSVFLEPLTGTRTGGSYISGRWVAGTPVALSFQGVVQNANAKDSQVLPEGTRADETIKIHTATALIAVDEETGTPGDVISYNSQNWRVYTIFDRKIGNYYKAILIKI